MNLELKITGASKKTDGLYRLKGKSGDGRAVEATAFQKGGNLVLQSVPQEPNTLGGQKVISWSGSVVADAKAKTGLAVQYDGVEADAVYTPKRVEEAQRDLAEKVAKQEADQGKLLDALKETQAVIKEQQALNAEQARTIAEQNSLIEKLQSK